MAWFVLGMMVFTIAVGFGIVIVLTIIEGRTPL